jgi:folate-dependent phosphoribosylglycinamide formyltransferase PurN
VQTRASSITTVVFTGGPRLDRQVNEFLQRLESDSDIELTGVFSQSPDRGVTGIARDLWKRRGLLAVPLLVQALCHSIYSAIVSPRQYRRRQISLRRLGPRIHYVADIHDADVIAHVRSLAPQLGLVYGGPLIKPELFEIPAFGTLGIHHGKLPEYRGKKTTFWAMYNGEHEVGVAIQRIGVRLDSGDILMQERLPVAKEALPPLKKRLEQAGLDLYIRAVHAVREGTATYTPQPGRPGKLYPDPGAGDIIRFWCRYIRRLMRA